MVLTSDDLTWKRHLDQILKLKYNSDCTFSNKNVKLDFENRTIQNEEEHLNNEENQSDELPYNLRRRSQIKPPERL